MEDKGRFISKSKRAYLNRMREPQLVLSHLKEQKPKHRIETHTPFFRWKYLICIFATLWGLLLFLAPLSSATELEGMGYNGNGQLGDAMTTNTNALSDFT